MNEKSSAMESENLWGWAPSKYEHTRFHQDMDSFRRRLALSSPVSIDFALSLELDGSLDLRLASKLVSFIDAVLFHFFGPLDSNSAAWIARMAGGNFRLSTTKRLLRSLWGVGGRSLTDISMNSRSHIMYSARFSRVEIKNGGSKGGKKVETRRLISNLTRRLARQELIRTWLGRRAYRSRREFRLEKTEWQRAKGAQIAVGAQGEKMRHKRTEGRQIGAMSPQPTLRAERRVIKDRTWANTERTTLRAPSVTRAWLALSPRLNSSQSSIPLQQQLLLAEIDAAAKLAKTSVSTHSQHMASFSAH